MIFFSKRRLDDEREAWGVRSLYLDKALKGGFTFVSYPEFYCDADTSYNHKHAGLIAVPKIESLSEEFLDITDGEKKELPNSLIYICDGLIYMFSDKLLSRNQMWATLSSDDPDFPIKGKYFVSNPEGSLNTIAWWLLNAQLEIFDSQYLALFPKAGEK